MECGRCVLYDREFKLRKIERRERLYITPAMAKKTLKSWAAIDAGFASGSVGEPLTVDEPGRHSLFPLRDPEMWAFRKKIEKLHWVTGEVDLSHDRGDLAKVTPGEVRLLEYVLAFFSLADELVLAGLDERAATYVRVKEGQHYLRAQGDQESVHSEAYSLQIQEIIPDPKRRAQVFDAVKNFPAVARMAAWVRFWTHGSAVVVDGEFSLAEAGDISALVDQGKECVFVTNKSLGGGTSRGLAGFVAAMALIEGAMFQSFFAALQFFKVRGLFPGVVTLNELISRDESVHASFWAFLARERLRSRPPFEAVRGLAAETARLGRLFFAEALPSPVVGLNAQLLGEYAEHAVDHIVTLMGYPPVFKTANPLKFMEAHSLNRVAKTNFFEHDTTQYQGLGHDSLEFGLDESPLENSLSDEESPLENSLFDGESPLENSLSDKEE